MSNLSTFFGAKPAFQSQDPMNQVAFGIYSDGVDDVYPRVGLFNHRLEYMGSVHENGDIHGSTAYNANYWLSFAGSEFTYSSTRVTALVTTAAQYPEQGGGSAAIMNGPLGHKAYLCPTSVSENTSPYRGVCKERLGWHAIFCGATFGLDQHYNLFTRYLDTKMVGANAGFYIRPNTMHSAQQAANDGANDTGNGAGDYDFVSTQTKASRVSLQVSGFMTSGYRVAAGGIAYNQRSKTLCILERPDDTGTPWRPVICKNAPNPADYMGKEVAYQAALTTALNISGARIVGPAFSGTNWNVQCYLFARPVLCDNNDIYWFQESNNASTSAQAVLKMTMNAGGTAYLAQDAASVHSNANSWAVPNYSSVNGTHIGNVEYQQSLDGETVMVYTCPYYFHGGLRYVLINLKTGKASKLETAQDTANSYGVSAFGASNFFIKKNANSNGVGTQQFVLNWEGYDRFNGGAGTYTGTENTRLINNTLINIMDAPNQGTDYTAIWRNTQYDNKAIVLASKNQFNATGAQ